MSVILNHLHQDHKNMAGLLDFLEREIRTLASGEDKDYGLLAKVVDYFNHYPTLYHHPYEDQLFAWLCGERPQFKAIVGELQGEHISQAQLGKELALLLTAVQSGHLVPRGKLIEDLSAYVTVQRKHIDKEESQLLKEIGNILTALDLDELPLPNRDKLDPLYGAALDNEYVDLASELSQ